MSRAIACGYCGGTHSSVAQVRHCWERASAAGAKSTASGAADSTQRPSSAVGEVSFAASSVLGRSVLVRPGQKPPQAWSQCERWDGDVDGLEVAWRQRRPLVIELDGDPPEPGVVSDPVWSLTPAFSLPGEKARFFAFANAIDARETKLHWAWRDIAVGLGASPGARADVVLPGGEDAYCDGGPLCWQAGVDGAAVISRVGLQAGSLVPFGSNDTDAELSEDQKAAVTAPFGSARIIAPAGSGKTRVLTERARHLLSNWNLPVGAVTLVAYNKRAAEEMVARSADLPGLQIRTLNSLALSVVNRAQRVTTAGEPEVRALLGRLVEFPRRANTDPVVAWMEALSRVRLGLEDPAKVEADYAGDVDGLPSVVESYRALLADRKMVDFDEQIYRAVETLLRHPELRSRARASCRVLLVDEFQDLTPAHLLMIRLLAGPAGDVFGVGDDDQTIYGYAGASPRWLIDYQRYFPGAQNQQLRVNYRCPPGVVTSAVTLLGHNRRRVAKEVVARSGRAHAKSDLRIVTSQDAVAATVRRVEELLGGGVASSDIAVLSRVNASLVPVQVSLIEGSVRVRGAVGEAYLSRSAVAAALAWLRLATSAPQLRSPSDVAAAARRPARGLSPKLVEWIAEQRHDSGWRRLAGRLSERDATKVVSFAADLASLSRLASKSTTARVLREVRDEVGLDRAMAALEGAHRRLDRSAQSDDLDSLVAIARLHPEPRSFEEWLRGVLARPSASDGVTMASIHAVKGQEWPHVVVHDVTSGVLPHRLADDVEEERRILHVAVTRASESATVVAGEPASVFVSEMVTPWKPPVDPVDEASSRTGEPASAADAPCAAHAASAADAASAAQVALREWRTRRARADKKPAYVYLTDATISAISETLPVDIDGLSAVKGLGPAKLQAYGAEILSLLDGVRRP